MIQTFSKCATVLFCALAVASMTLVGTTLAGVPAGVGGVDGPLPTEFEAVENMFNVGSDTNPVRIVIDPTGDPWPKTFVIPPGTTITPGMVFPVWESLMFLPGSGRPLTNAPLPLTDWHEEIHEDPTGLPFSWGGGHLVVHDPFDPMGPPIVDVPGELSPDGQQIWFGPFPPVSPPPTGLPVWIHKELVYTGNVVITPSPNPIPIHIWEFPTTVPEPAALALVFVGSSVLAFIRRRR